MKVNKKIFEVLLRGIAVIIGFSVFNPEFVSVKAANKNQNIERLPLKRKKADYEISPGVIGNSNENRRIGWILDVNEDRVDVKSFENVKVTLTNKRNGEIYVFTPRDKLVIRQNSLEIPFPADEDRYERTGYFIDICGLKYLNGKSIVIKRNLWVRNRTGDLVKYDIRSEVYRIDYKSQVISGVRSLTTVEELVSRLSFKNANDVVVIDHVRKVAMGSNCRVSTGDMVVVIYKGEVKYKFSVSVVGDVTGCGHITKDGIGLVTKHLTGDIELLEPFISAADMNGDGRVDTEDLHNMQSVYRLPYIVKKGNNSL